MNRQELSAATAIGLLYLVRMLGLFMVLPVLPLLVDDIPGATPFLIGVALGIYGLSQGLLQIPFGLLSDRWGRKPVIAMGLLMFVAGSIIAAVSEGITGLIAGRLLQGCGAVASTLLALMSDVTRVDQRSKSMAIIGIAIAGSFGLSLVLGPLVSDIYGLPGIFNLSALLGIVALGILFLIVPSPAIRTVNLDSGFQRDRWSQVVAAPDLWRLNISVFVLHFLLISCFSVFPLLFIAAGQIDAGEHSLYYLALLGVSFVLMLPFMWLADRWKNVRAMLVGMVVLALVSFFLLSGTDSYWFVMSAMVMFFMAFNLLETVLPAQVSKLSAAGSRGTAMGVYTTCQFLGIFAGGLVSGWVLSVSDISGVMAVNMVVAGCWLLICLSFPRTAHLGSRTIRLMNLGNQSAHERLDALLSIDGVIDAVVIEADQVAYLKVDEQRIDDEKLRIVVAGDSNPVV